MSATIQRIHGHVHVEAFKLMLYACETCAHRETIWNSRDGVTPFGCNCPSCGKIMRHVEWQRDVYAPNHKLHDRQRFWRDGTPDEAEAIIRRRIDHFRAEHPIPPAKEAALIKMAREGTDEGEFRKGWPTLDSHNALKR